MSLLHYELVTQNENGVQNAHLMVVMAPVPGSFPPLLPFHLCPSCHWLMRLKSRKKMFEVSNEIPFSVCLLCLSFPSELHWPFSDVWKASNMSVFPENPIHHSLWDGLSHVCPSQMHLETSFDEINTSSLLTITNLQKVWRYVGISVYWIVKHTNLSIKFLGAFICTACQWDFLSRSW